MTVEMLQSENEFSYMKTTELLYTLKKVTPIDIQDDAMSVR